MTYYVDELIPTQNWLRREVKPSTYLGDSKIQLTMTEDGLLYVWNGHHRLASIWLHCKQLGIPDNKITLSDSSVSVANMSYAQLGSINFDKGYVTPFDPRRECRREDFIAYKADINELYQKSSYQRALYHIVNRSSEYRESRLINHVSQLKIKQKEETHHVKTNIFNNPHRGGYLSCYCSK